MGLRVVPGRLCLSGIVVWLSLRNVSQLIAQNAFEIVQRSVSVNSSDFEAQPRYSFKERDISAKLDGSSKSKAQHSKTSEITMIDGSPYTRLIELNGEPLPPLQAQREAAKLAAAKTQRASQSSAQRQARIAKYQRDRANDHLLMQELVKAFDFKLERSEEVNGHACYVLDALPKPGYQAQVEKAKVLSGMRGRMWIAKEGYHWVRVQAEVTQPVAFGFVLAKVNQGTTFQLDQTPVNGAWLPEHFDQTVNARILGMFGVATSDEQQYFDYRRVDGQ